jgi:hypothetical protein
VRGVGEILEKLPLPGLVDAEGVPIGGPMHRVPRLQWKTWVRLAFVEAGSDWRSLNKLAVENGFLRDYGIAPDENWYNGAYGVCEWDEASGVIAGNTNRPSCGKFSVADPRGFAPDDSKFHGLTVNDWKGTAGALTGQRSPGSSMQSVADPRVDGHEKSVQLGVGHWTQPSAVMKGDVSVGTGRYAVADPRMTWHPEASSSKLRVTDWSDATRTVTGSQQVGSGAQAVADPRPGYGAGTHNHVLKVTPWDRTGGTVTASHHPAGGALAVADPRAARSFAGGKYRITRFDEASGTVISGSTTGNGAFAVADPRPEALAPRDQTKSAMSAITASCRWADTPGAITGHASTITAPCRLPIRASILRCRSRPKTSSA